MKRIPLTWLLLAACSVAFAQSDGGVTVGGSIQSDILLPESDAAIGAETDGDKLKTNTYVDLTLRSRHVDAGARFEYLEHPLPGFERSFKGWGVRHYWVKGKLERGDLSGELTLGSFYEQFGSGFILRTYEERSLGIDNALLGARLQLKPVRGVTLKALTGRQRRYWHFNDGQVSGADLELSLDALWPALRQSSTRLTLGGSWVNKYEPSEDVFADLTHKVNFPKFVNAWDVRASLGQGAVSVLAEYARKTEDPSFDNDYTFREGTVAMLSTSYSKKGTSLLLQAKRSDNMSFRSRRSMLLTSSFVNHLPAFTQDQTYALAALYPYSTQLVPGEWAYQAELGYLFKRRTALGGRYGMNLHVNFSYVRAIDADYVAAANPMGTEGYRSAFFSWGDQTYYRDFDVQLSRKFSKSFKLNLMYMNQLYNKTVVEGEGGTVRSNIFVADGKYQLAPKTALRGELQYLTTRQDEGDWAFGLLELSLVPHWMFTVSDMWNCGDTDVHYYQGLVTYSAGAHRLQAGYGRTRAGFNCSGGVCRYVPATKGVTVSYNYQF